MSDFANPTHIEWGNAEKTYGMVQYGKDSDQFVVFYNKSVFNPSKSLDKGARHFDKETYVKMQPPGERLNIIDRPVKEEDKRRFPTQWNQFLQNQTQVPEGTPIDLLFPNYPDVADNLRAYGVHTIQQLAKLSDSAMMTIGMGGQEWKNLAIQYMENASSGAVVIQMQAELTKKNGEIASLQRQMQQLIAAHNSLVDQVKNPNTAKLQPGWEEGFDVQIERIDANHPSQPVVNSRARKPKKKVDKIITEQDFPTVDLTQDVEQEQQEE